MNHTPNVQCGVSSVLEPAAKKMRAETVREALLELGELAPDEKIPAMLDLLKRKSDEAGEFIDQFMVRLGQEVRSTPERPPHDFSTLFVFLEPAHIDPLCFTGPLCTLKAP